MFFSISLPSESRKMICLRMKISSLMRWKTPGWLSFSSMALRKATLSARGTLKGSIWLGLVKAAWMASFSARRTGKVTRSAATRALSKALSKMRAQVAQVRGGGKAPGALVQHAHAHARSRARRRRSSGCRSTSSGSWLLPTGTSGRPRRWRRRLSIVRSALSIASASGMLLYFICHGVHRGHREKQFARDSCAAGFLVMIGGLYIKVFILFSWRLGVTCS